MTRRGEGVLEVMKSEDKEKKQKRKKKTNEDKNVHSYDKMYRRGIDCMANCEQLNE